MSSRKVICSGKCILGLTKCFKDLMSKLALSKEAKISFFGTPSVCLPFVELLAYAIRDLTNNMLYIPNTSTDMAVKLRYIEGYGFQIGERADPRNSDVAVLLGGLAMPKSKLTAEDVMRAVTAILKKEGTIIGVDFMGIFDQNEWTNKIPFSYILDCYCESKVESLK
ncbi:MAG: DUF2124 family protein [Candidatus Nezhaarchaeales archaeon]